MNKKPNQNYLNQEKISTLNKAPANKILQGSLLLVGVFAIFAAGIRAII